MKIISLVNQKGGVAKTTAAVYLSVLLSEPGKAYQCQGLNVMYSVNSKNLW